MRLVATVLLSFVVLSAGIFAFRSRVSYSEQDRDQISAPGNASHWMGTDELGRDRTVRTAGAILLGVAGSVMAAAVASALAVAFGVVGAFSTAIVGKLLIYLCDVALTLPWLFLLMIVRSALPLTLSPSRSALLTFLLLALLGVPVFVRLNYARAMSMRRAGWLLHGRASGISVGRLLKIHLIPHLKPLFLTQFLTYVPVCIIAEANLGALGLGVSQPIPSWGSMLLELQNSMLLAGSRWVYLPMCLLVFVLLMLEMMMFEVDG